MAPAGLFAPERLARGMAVVAEWGYTLQAAPNLGARARYTAGSVAERAADLAWALTAEDVDAVWFARGGFGTAHLLPHLPWDRLDGRPVLGFSDATALLNALQQRGLPAIHAPVLQGLSDDTFGSEQAVLCDPASRTHLRALLQTGHMQPWRGEWLAGPAVAVRGRLIGGNLAVLASVAGTPWALQAAGAILLLEDVAEAPYRIDRLLTQLVQSGALRGVRGLALGDFLDTRLEPSELRSFLGELLAPLGVPVIAGLPVGHGARNLAWPVGAEVELTPESLAFL